MNYGRDALVLGGLLTVFVATVSRRSAPPPPAAPIFASAVPSFASADAGKSTRRRIASKKKDPKPAPHPRGERLRESGESLFGKKTETPAELPKEVVETKAVPAKGQQIATQ